MKTIKQYAIDFFENERGAANILTAEQVLTLLISAVHFYRGFTSTEIEKQILVENRCKCNFLGTCDTCKELKNNFNITENLLLDYGEYAIIKPLFLLYVERETALQLEASRQLGADVFGRSSSEISGDINNYELQLQKLAFNQDIISV